MNRFYIPREDIGRDEIRLKDSEDVHHLLRVLRLAPGEEIQIVDGEGAAYRAVFQAGDRTSVLLKIKERSERKAREDQFVRLCLAVALPKNARFEDVIEKATQLGVDEVIPLVTERTLIDPGRAKKKTERYRRVLNAAAKQSGVLFLPQLREPISWKDLLSSASSYSLRLLPNLSSRSVTLKSALADFRGGRLLACIGPEGDFSPAEIRDASEAGFLGVSLGDSVLRVDTAAISIAAFIRVYADGR